MSTIKDLTRRIGEVNTANGWRSSEERTGQDLVNARVARLALITTEVAEAIEEIRAGHDVTETYYSGGVGWATDDDLEPHERLDANDNLRKPEGMPSELADVVIRTLDAADAWGIDIEAAIEEKLAYNATRGYRHGGKTV